MQNQATPQVERQMSTEGKSIRDSGNTKLASIYARTSSPNQRDNYSIDEQINQCQNYCEQRGWQIKYVFVDESQSGKSIEGRPKFQLMMQKAESKAFDVIVVWKLDRFARSLVDLVNVERTLRGYDVELCSVTEFVDTTTSVGRFNYRSLASFAELERELIGERARMGLYGLAREGRWPNAHPALGYDRGTDGRLHVNEKEARLVNEIFEQYVKLRSMPAVAFWLNSIDAKSKNGAKGAWSARTVKNVLCNKLYIGQYSIAGHVEQIDSMKIVNEKKLFNKAGRIMKRYEQRSNSKVSRAPMPLDRKHAKLQKVLIEYQEFLVQSVA
jgi:site-specific DNA recombinase